MTSPAWADSTSSVADDSDETIDGENPPGEPPLAFKLPVDENGDEWIVSAEPLEDAEVQQLLAEDAPEISPQAEPPTSPPAANWPGCGVFDDNNKLVMEYTRLRASTSMTGSVAVLRCGSESYGYRHIQAERMTQWQTLAAPVNINWRDMASWAISWNLYDPDKVSFDSSRNTYCFSREVYMYQNDELTYVSTPRTALGTTAQRIITAFPTGSQCPGTNIL